MLSEVPEGWSLQRFGEIASVKNGFAFKSKDFVDSQSGVAAVVRMSDLKKGTVEASLAKKIPLVCLEGLERFRLEAGDFVFGMSGSLSNYAVVPASSVPLYLNQRVGKLEAKSTDAVFLRYLYTSESFMRLVEKSASGNAQLNISSKQIESFEVFVPPLNEQHRIAEILSSVDASIQATQAVIEQAERVKRGLMEELLTGGLGSEAIERGEVPDGWVQTKFIDFVTLKRGYDLPVAQRIEGDVPVVASNGQVGWHNESKVEAPVIVTGRSGTIGKVELYEMDCHPLNTTLYSTDLHGNNPYFAKYFIQHFKVERYATGTGVPTLNRNLVHEVVVVVPPLNEQERVAGILLDFESYIDKQKSIVEQNQRTKCGLMDDLLTGKVRTV